MNNHKKQIIISEIKHWKQSNLLPTHYCDFLITLYAQGEDVVEDLVVPNSILVKEKKSLTIKIFLLLVLVMASSASLFIFVAYPAITIGLSFLIILLLLLLSRRKTVKKSALLPFIYISSAFLLLALSFKLWLVYFEAYPMMLIGLLILNSMLWLFVGRLLKLLYFTISGASGIILIIVFLFIQF